MKKLRVFFGTLLLAGASGCSSAYYASAGYPADDLYASHDKATIARNQQAAAEARKAEAEARRAEWEALIAEAEAQAAEESYRNGSDVNPYTAVLADTYESAYARRLRGFESPTYRLPASYYNFRYGEVFTYVSAYDPAFYNIIVMGDQVWVEPKYITSMFGTWGRPLVVVDPWYYGWNAPSAWWGPSFSFGSWGWSFGWGYNPWYSPWHNPWYDPWWGPGWGPGWHGHHHWAPRPPHNYRLDAGGRGPSRYVPGRTSGGHRYQSGYNSGRYGSGSRGTGGRGGTYYQSGGRSSSSIFDRGGSSGRYENGYNNGSRPNRGYDSGRSSFDGSRSNKRYNSGSSFGGSRGSSSSFGSGGSRGGSSGSMGGGSRGSSGGGSRGGRDYGGR